MHQCPRPHSPPSSSPGSSTQLRMPSHPWSTYLTVHHSSTSKVSTTHPTISLICPVHLLQRGEEEQAQGPRSLHFLSNGKSLPLAANPLHGWRHHGSSAPCSLLPSSAEADHSRAFRHGDTGATCSPTTNFISQLQQGHLALGCQRHLLLTCSYYSSRLWRVCLTPNFRHLAPDADPHPTPVPPYSEVSMPIPSPA
ncbi:hypothetical protein D5F01_LYC02291 [Larimichthys crocea]|uniref:Uncharacterized protein n=1 Tax=Larimichthys crocea TaxID=215358 RepID=A0A6G0J8K9_LARCR|nr:hypothetical protein D5F01_LYC02291 [Larimichthys crocea]